MASNDLDDNFKILINQIKQAPERCEIVLRELNSWLCSNKNSEDNISCVIDILYAILEQRPDLASSILKTSLLVYEHNNVLSYSLLINLVHIDQLLVDDAFSILKDYLDKKSSEGMLVCLFQLINKLATQHPDIKDKIHDFISYALTLESNGIYSEKEAQSVLKTVK